MLPNILVLAVVTILLGVAKGYVIEIRLASFLSMGMEATTEDWIILLGVITCLFIRDSIPYFTILSCHALVQFNVTRIQSG